MKIDKEKVQEWFHDRWEDIRSWWKWNYDWVLVAVGTIIFAVLLAIFGLYVEAEGDRNYDYEIHYGKDRRLRCNEEDITRDGSTLIIKRGETTYVLTDYTLEDNRHIK
jgi:hypothetical protein